MAENDDLIPVFFPPLAACLARAEAVKGSPLTETEVVRIRDRAVCMMMSADRAQRMSESRGYRDVDPENCWADWHRLRVQLTGNGYLPRIVLCVPGSAEFPKQCGPLLEAEAVEHEWQGRAPRMAGAFTASACPYNPSLTEEDFAGVDRHEKVLYVLSPNFTAQDAPAVSRSFLRLGGRLLGAGGLGLKCESSGIAHGRERWLELARAAEGEEWQAALFRAYVQLPLQDGGDYYTCGLHLMGLPDLIVADDLLRQAVGNEKHPSRAAIDLFVTFGLYLLVECPPGGFGSGHTFSADAESSRFRVRWEPCTGYEEDDFFFNPFGRWRFAEVVGQGGPS